MPPETPVYDQETQPGGGSRDEVALHALTSTPEFDRAGYNGKLHSIGLAEHALV